LHWHLTGGFSRTPISKASEALKEGDVKMLWTILVVLLILWLIGFSTGVVGNLIHLVLVIALVLLVINLITGRRTV
jgi:uncharacterized membrane protein